MRQKRFAAEEKMIVGHFDPSTSKHLHCPWRIGRRIGFEAQVLIGQIASRKPSFELRD
jgi:hypothetical protein